MNDHEEEDFGQTKNQNLEYNSEDSIVQDNNDITGE